MKTANSPFSNNQYEFYLDMSNVKYTKNYLDKMERKFKKLMFTFKKSSGCLGFDFRFKDEYKESRELLNVT